MRLLLGNAASLAKPAKPAKLQPEPGQL